jgi:predicted MFS family arabinose efflux permease
MSSNHISHVPKTKTFTRYQVLMIVILAILQFTIILDFMVLSPLGVMVMPKLHINPAQFSRVVSFYAFSAGISGLLAAGFADKFDRKKLLLFFYTGFIVGTVCCALATNYPLLLAARIVTGIFGGVISSISFAIVADIFKMETRGRVMGFVQMAFAVSQVLGLPIGLILANQFDWHAPFWMIAGFGILLGIVIVTRMQPITEHLKIKSDRNPFQHLAKTISNSAYLRAFLGTSLLATGGYMLMPFGSNFAIFNLGITTKQLPWLYGITGGFSILFGPLVGRASDKIGKYKMFLIGTAISLAMVILYTNLGVTAFPLIVTLNVILFVGISSRMISASALMTAVPEPQDRGAFMSINSSTQQFSGGVASLIAGLIVYQQPSGHMDHYPTLGYVVAGSMIVAAVLMFAVNKYVNEKNAKAAALKANPLPAVESV